MGKPQLIIIYKYLKTKKKKKIYNKSKLKFINIYIIDTTIFLKYFLFNIMAFRVILHQNSILHIIRKIQRILNRLITIITL